MRVSGLGIGVTVFLVLMAAVSASRGEWGGAAFTIGCAVWVGVDAWNGRYP